MIKSRKNKLAEKIIGSYIIRLLKKNFYRIHIFGEEKIKLLNNDLPAIFYANHSNWWDGFVSYYLSSKRWKRDDYLMMDFEQMKKYRFFRYIGVFSVDRENPREAVRSIDYASSLIKGTNRVLWIFPQGGIHSQDLRPVEFYSGITSIASRIDSLNLLPVAIRYEFILEQRPEIFIRIGEPYLVSESHRFDKNFTSYLCNELVKELDIMKMDVITNKFENYQNVFTGTESRNKTIDRLKSR